ncbi:DEAD/DEAH box helicase [Vibrio brasiliensis]|uniref:protein DpdF n=1 Tax=Vibrio brasiliensis TaxID=170652 RepID=UPI001EFEB825|nr:protein DpdF [Vibrio brasiliensis]MCG9751345.1 DEAD/DEAH box helicase [Vibrio brasiliensis]
MISTVLPWLDPNAVKLSARDFLQGHLKHVCNELNDFPDNQFTQRLLQALSDPTLSLSSFWLLARDCLWAAKMDKFPAALDLCIRPSAEQFEFAKACGLSMASGTTTLTVAKQDIAPELLPVYSLQQKKRMRPVAMDPALKMKFAGRYSSYTCAAQRTAVRTGLLAKENSTVIVNLPTGCGKTLVGHAVALFTKPQALTVMVVPTIALAIEQGQRVKEMLSEAREKVVPHYAWHSGLAAEDKQRIRAQIHSGQQKVLLVSPESMLSGLLRELFRLAERGKLGALIIDEAHLIGSWGAGFRPDFQRLGLLVASLRQLSPSGLKTVLMSATFTEQNLRTIESLFCDVGQSAVVMNGGFLRQEFSTNKQWVTAEEHRDVVFRKVLTQPKPLIIYTTEVKECVALAEFLRAQGISRLATFHGDTSSQDREALLKQWQDNQLDIMVATSAFGVGMDKGDVRSVLHACMPENIDRYYQEVGRAGRDGRAAHCEMVIEDRQVKTARALNTDTIISQKKGLARWKGLWQRGGVVRGDSHMPQKLIDLRNQPEHVEQRTKSNTYWNWMTVLLLQRTGLIKLAYPKPGDWSELDDDEQYNQQAWEDYIAQVLVTVVDTTHLDEKTWQAKVEEQRSAESAARRQGFHILHEWLKSSDMPLCHRLREFYRLNGERPTLACGGCPACRAKKQQEKAAYEEVQQAPVSARLFELPRVEVGYRVSVLGMEESSPMVDIPVYFSPQQTDLNDELLDSFVLLLRQQKVVALAAPSDLLERLNSQYLAGLGQFWLLLSRDEWLSDCPVVASYSKMIIDDRQQGEASAPEFSEVRTIYCAREDLRDPELSHRKWWEGRDSAMSLTNFKNNIEAI